MAVGSVTNPNMSFDEWLKANNKTGEVQQPQQQNPPGAVTDNGVPVGDAQRLHNGESIFDVASNPTPTKETATAGGASSAGVGTQPSGVTDNGSRGVDNVVGSDNNNTVLSAGATGHTPQTQAPTLASGLTASQGNENLGAQGGPTGGPVNSQLYAQYEADLQAARIADEGGDVSTGEGTLSTGDVDGAGETGGTTGPDGPTGADDGVPAPPADGTNPSDPANLPPDNTEDGENPSDPANDNPENINKQEENRQEEILDANRFRKLDDQAA